MNAVSEPRSTRPARGWLGHAWLPCGLLLVSLLPLVARGHDGRRIGQLMLLALPVALWLVWPLQSTWTHRLRAGVAWLCAMAFALDGVARAHLLAAYQAAPDGALVLGAMANTSLRESGEYLSMHWRAMAVDSALLAATGLVAGACVRRGARRSSRAHWHTPLVWMLVMIAAVGYASKPWRRLHPFVFWPKWAQSAQALRAGWVDQQQMRERALGRARDATPVVVRDGPATVMLVIADSINRDNMALYGYGRATTPRLLDHKAQLNDEMLVVGSAWSVDASTLPSLRNIFWFGRPENESSAHVLALARAAGYKTWWISNHDDVAIEQSHARLADVVDMINRTPGRASASLDGEVLDCVQGALEDSASRKLIVVHLMGAHPHYRLRFPSDANPFDDHVDAVETKLAKEGRSAWVRRYRQEYDAAVLYHDFVVSELLQMMRADQDRSEFRAWMYLSDHGQEVGHVSDRAGHSPTTASGYRIPTIIWRNWQPPHPRPDIAGQPFRSDWTGWVVADLLDIRWAGNETSRSILRDEYVWRAPTLPVSVPSFTR